MIKVGFIGSGNMGSALAKAAKKCADAEIYLYDKDEARAKKAALEISAKTASNTEIAKTCDYIFLAVKPNIIPIAAKEIADTLKARSGYTIVSMAAGISLAALDEAFEGVDAPIIRIMPNTPAAYGEGMMLVCNNGKVSKEALSGFEKIMEKSGRLDSIPEALIDAASAVSGCGPAFVYMFIEALADGGVACGLPRDKALDFAAQTLIGAAKTVMESGIHPEALKDAVCSPGGTTIAGVHALEEGAFRASASNAVIAAYKRTLELKR